MSDRVRRVVMSDSPDGTSRFSHVEELSTRPGMSDLHDVWGWDEAPRLPFYGEEPYPGLSMLPGGVGNLRVMMLTMPPPGSATEAHRHEGDYAAEGVMLAEGGIPGMHSTDTIDIGFVISGRIEVIGNDGSSQVLEPGDVYVQNGAQHAWRNAGEGEARMGAVLISVPRD